MSLAFLLLLWQDLSKLLMCHWVYVGCSSDWDEEWIHKLEDAHLLGYVNQMNMFVSVPYLFEWNVFINRGLWSVSITCKHIPQECYESLRLEISVLFWGGLTITVLWVIPGRGAPVFACIKTVISWMKDFSSVYDLKMPCKQPKSIFFESIFLGRACFLNHQWCCLLKTTFIMLLVHS